MVTVTADEIWSWLSDLPDPEIPVISLVDLGIIRDVAVTEKGRAQITVTPTYSGCPATAVINLDIVTALAARGVETDLIPQLSPAWTTDWISDAGREKLRAYGIAPPATTAADACAGMLRPVACPNCGGSETAEIARHGSTPCKALWRCSACLEPFDYFKPH